MSLLTWHFNLQVEPVLNTFIDLAEAAIAVEENYDDSEDEEERRDEGERGEEEAGDSSDLDSPVRIPSTSISMTYKDHSGWRTCTISR